MACFEKVKGVMVLASRAWMEVDEVGLPLASLPFWLIWVWLLPLTSTWTRKGWLRILVFD